MATTSHFKDLERYTGPESRSLRTFPIWLFLTALLDNHRGNICTLLPLARADHRGMVKHPRQVCVWLLRLDKRKVNIRRSKDVLKNAMFIGNSTEDELRSNHGERVVQKLLHIFKNDDTHGGEQHPIFNIGTNLGESQDMKPGFLDSRFSSGNPLHLAEDKIILSPQRAEYAHGFLRRKKLLSSILPRRRGTQKIRSSARRVHRLHPSGFLQSFLLSLKFHETREPSFIRRGTSLLSHTLLFLICSFRQNCKMSSSVTSPPSPPSLALVIN